MYSSAHPVPLRGRRPSSRTLGGLRWTLVYAETTAWISVRQNRVVLAPVAGVKLPEKREQNRQRRSQPRTRLRGEHGISRKAIAQGRPGVLRCPVCSCAAYLVQSAHGTAGAARTRSSLRPLFGEGGKFLAKLGRIAPRECELAFVSRCNNKHRRRPGLEPGPITTGSSCANGLYFRVFIERSRGMGPGVRRDDIVTSAAVPPRASLTETPIEPVALSLRLITRGGGIFCVAVQRTALGANLCD